MYFKIMDHCELGVLKFINKMGSMIQKNVIIIFLLLSCFSVSARTIINVNGISYGIIDEYSFYGYVSVAEPFANNYVGKIEIPEKIEYNGKFYFVYNRKNQKELFRKTKCASYGKNEMCFLKNEMCNFILFFH